MSASAAAYGFPADLTDDEILSRLLALNLQRVSEEAKDAKPKTKRPLRTMRDDEML